MSWYSVVCLGEVEGDCTEVFLRYAAIPAACINLFSACVELWAGRPPNWFLANRWHVALRVLCSMMLSMSLDRLVRRLIGRYSFGLGLGRGIILASFSSSGNSWPSIMHLFMAMRSVSATSSFSHASIISRVVMPSWPLADFLFAFFRARFSSRMVTGGGGFCAVFSFISAIVAPIPVFLRPWV